MLRIHPDVEAGLAAGDARTVAEARPVLELLSAGFEIRRFLVLRSGIWIACAVPDAAVAIQFALAQECLVVGNGSTIEFEQKMLMETAPPEWGLMDERVRLVASTDPLAEPGCAAWGAAKRVDIVLFRSVPPPDASAEDTRLALYRVLAACLWRRDLFDDGDPVRHQREFYGRMPVVGEALGKIVSGASVAVFGLRKVGKSSLLARVEEALLADGMALNAIARLDGSSSRIKTGRWWTAASDMLVAWEASLKRSATEAGSKIQPKATELRDAVVKKIVDTGRLASAFEKDVVGLVRSAQLLRAETRHDASRLIVLVDECEHLFPHLDDPGNWRADFFALWNALIAIKGRLSNPAELVFVLVGSNPSGVERGSLIEQPNPLFRTHAIYLRPMNRVDSGALLNGVGARIGLAFSADALDYIHAAVGGHPLLLRRFGSAVHRTHLDRAATVTIGAERATQIFRKYKRDFYDQVMWILNCLRKVAPDEERLLRDIALGGAQAYQEMWKENDLRDTYAESLERYGLVQFQADVPVIGLQLIRDALQKPSANEFDEQKKQMKSMVDTIEAALRSRLAVDLVKYKTTSESVHAVISAIPGDARNRPLARQELIDLGEAHGLPAVLEAMNWGDYEILLNKFYDHIEWSGEDVERQKRLATIKITFLQAHLVRHNNDRELRELISAEGFAALYARFCGVRDMFAA